MTFCPNHRRAEVALADPDDPDGRPPATVIATRFNGAPAIEDNKVGLRTFFSPEFAAEWAELVRAAARRGHRVVLVASSGLHDDARVRRTSDVGAARGLLDAGVADYARVAARLGRVLADFQRSGALVVWRGNNHGQDDPSFDARGAHDLSAPYPASEMRALRRYDAAMRTVFDRQGLGRLGARFLNVTEVTRVWFGDGGWEPERGWWLRGAARGHAPQLPFVDARHVGPIGAWQWGKLKARLGGPPAPVEIGGCITHALLSTVVHGCSAEVP
eukprot:TRINITY_DN30830_c0_g1_i1.p1 TRINITY_DN30830_c0_g1~~TRINITY_DN30830_c0_g1_i1.p1  ORF type:complete len:273 (+),score=51.66 TRINITY_DN30830_c0_g1_i1:663-1481(+)